MNPKTQKTLYVLVTCSKDSVRDDLALKVIDSVDEFPKENLIAFDNASTFIGTKEKLGITFDNCFFSSINYGFWSAVNWCVENHISILGKKMDYVYVIESDAIHWKNHRQALLESESYLNRNPEIGSVRMQEFSVGEKHLYDKNDPVQGSRKWAWMRQSNHFSGEKAYFNHHEGNFYRTNLVPQVCSLNRVDFMKSAFSELRKMKKFSEIDFQYQYFKFYKETSVYNGGIFDTRLCFESSATQGSYLDSSKFGSYDYRMTREDIIEEVSEEKIMNRRLK